MRSLFFSSETNQLIFNYLEYLKTKSKSQLFQLRFLRFQLIQYF